MIYTVGAVARLAGVTVRTLHHYDEIGLLTPVGRTDAGYRRYGDADLDRLQRILFYRELGFGLDQIREVMTDRQGTALAHLRRQRGLLRERIGRLERMVAAVEKEMEARNMGIPLSPEERFEVFGDFNPDDHAVEVEKRWGDTDPYRESARRTARYTKADWLRIKAEGKAAIDQLVAAMEAGKPADGPEAIDGAEAHRRQINDAFYDCSHSMHVGLAEMYLADSRFTATYEKIAPGLAQYLHDAIKANAALRGSG
jgi:MerR family transcriptional regulator, thiopeptide resistance regulator